MSADKKTPDNGSLWVNTGVFAAGAIIVLLIFRGVGRHLENIWQDKPWIIILVTAAVALTAALLGISTWWNRKVESDYDKSVTADEPGSVYLGKDEKNQLVFLKQRFRTMHAQVLGTTSAGKTESVILPWAINDIESGNGLLIIDGKSDSSFLDKLYAYAHRAGRAQDFRLFSLAHVGASHTFNPLVGGNPAEVVERVLSSFKVENEYYRQAQYKVFRLLVRLIVAKGKVPTFFLVHRLLTDMKLTAKWASEIKDDSLRFDLQKLVKETPKERAERISGLETFLSHFAQGEYASLFNAENPDIRFDDVLASGKICYFQLPSMYLPFLAEATGKLVLQSFQNAVSKRHLSREKEMKFFSCFLDDFQDYIYEGFGSLLNKSRSANIGVVFSHQAIGDLNKVSPAFTNVVLTNTNVKVLMRTSDPETSDYFARSIGTVKAEKMTERRRETFIGSGKTGDGSVREVDEYQIHPNEIRTQGTGQGVLTIPHAKGIKVLKLRFQRRADIPAIPIPDVPKELPQGEEVLEDKTEASAVETTTRTDSATAQI